VLDQQVQQADRHSLQLRQRLEHLAGDEVEATRFRRQADLTLEPHRPEDRTAA